MEVVIKKPGVGKLRELPFFFKLRRIRQERPAPRSQAEIDRLANGWEHKSQSTRARMARIGI